MRAATGLGARRFPSSVAPAASAASTLQWKDTGAAPIAKRAPSRTRARVAAMTSHRLAEVIIPTARKAGAVGPSLLDQQAKVLGVLDRLATSRDAELAIDRDRLGLDGVRRQVQALAELAERVMRGQQREQPQLRRRQPRRPYHVGAHGFELRAQLVGLAPEDAKVRLPAEQVVDLPEHRPGAGDVGGGDEGADARQARLGR